MRPSSAVGTGLKAACAAAAMATCWAGPASAEVVVPNATLESDLSVALENVHLVYGLNFSYLAHGSATALGDIGVGPTVTPVFLVDNITADNPWATFPESLSWSMLGTYGDDGVAISAWPLWADNNLGEAWADLDFGSTTESDLYDALVSSDMSTIMDFVSDYYHIMLVPYGDQATVANFSNLSINGSAILVPEPLSLGLIGVGALVLLGRRRI